jgi:hypothetical protein
MKSKRSQEARPAGFSSLAATVSIPQSPNFSGKNSETFGPVSEDRAKLFNIRRLASKIMSIKHLRTIIKSADPKLRKEVFYLITPHITRFKVPSYRQLLGRSASRA